MKLKTKHLRFGEFRLYPSEHLLLRDGDAAVPLAPKAFEILLNLASSHGHLVGRDELMHAIWPDSFVEETNLTVNISLLRKALGDMADGKPYIETVPRKGYRFKAEVVEIAEGPDEKPAELATPLPATPISTPRPVSTIADRRLAPGGLALVTMGVIALFFFGLLWYARKNPTPTVSASVRSMAILPFRALDSAADDEYLGLGLTDALITRLGGLHQMVVRPVGAIRKYTAVDDPISAGKELSVDSVMEGSIQRLGDRTRVTVRLLRVNDGQVIWNGTFDEKLSDMFAVEDSISQRLASTLFLNLSNDEQRRLARPSTGNGDAYQLYLKGRFYWNKRTVEGVNQSLDYFQRATVSDPNYALAYSGLADAYVLAGSYGYSILPPTTAMPKAKAAAEKALSLDDTLAEAHTSLAYVLFTYDWNWIAAEQEFRRAISLNSTYANAHHWYAHELTALGRAQEALSESKLAVDLSPSEAVMHEHMGWDYLMDRNYDNAIKHCQEALVIDPKFLLAHRVLAQAYEYQGQHDQAIAEFQKGVELSKGDPVARAYLARGYAAAGNRGLAVQLLNELEQLSKSQYVSPAEIGAVYSALNQPDNAFQWLDKAYADRTSSLIYLRVDRVYDGLRSDPRFNALLKKMNL